MKKLLFALLLVAMVGSSFADVLPERRLARPQVNLPQQSVNQVWLGPLAPVFLRVFAPSWWPVEPRFNAPQELDRPKPPVCDLFCYVRPLQGIAE